MIERTEEDGVVCLRMCHGKASALDLEFLRALRVAFDEERERSTAPVVLTGTGRIFSAGVDLLRVTSAGDDYIRAFIPALDEALLAIFDFPRPVVAAVNGHAIAGGAVIASTCDRRVFAASGATIGVPELLVGVPFPAIPLEMVRRVLPQPHFETAVLLGECVAGERALALGWVDELRDADEVLPRALETARELARIPAQSYASTKELMHAESNMRMRSLADAQREAMIEQWCCGTVQDAIRAFAQRTLSKSAAPSATDFSRSS